MCKIVILADDLTGACDTGIKIKHLGYKTIVIVDGTNYAELKGYDAGAISINTNSRSVTPKTAYFLAADAIQIIKEKTDDFVFYKKIDSILRGNIGSEIDACLDNLPYDFALIAPAYPCNGRLIVDGNLTASNSESMKSPMNAAKAIQRTTRRKVEVVSIDVIRRGAAHIYQKVRGLVKDGAELVLLDTASDDDFESITMAAKMFTGRCLNVGSAGWVPHLFKDEKSKARYIQNTGGAVNGHILMAVGTRHPVTVAQISELRGNKELTFCLIQVTRPGDGVETTCTEHPSPRAQATCTSDFNTKGIVVTTDLIYRGEAFEGRAEVYGDISNKEIVSALSGMVEEITSKVPVGAIIMSGGDVSGGVLKQIGVQCIELEEELYSGIVTGNAKMKNGDPLLVITKSGGFGDKTALSSLYEYARGGS